MTTKNENVNQAIYAFGLEYSYRSDMKFAIEMASDHLETINDVNLFELWLALFVAGKESVIVEKINEDCTWRNEEIKIAA